MAETPAQACRKAAAKIRTLVRSVRDDLATNDYWACDHPDAGEDEIYTAGVIDGLGGEAGDFAGSWTPGVALAIAGWLEAVADDIETMALDYGGEFPTGFHDDTWTAALTAATAYLGGSDA